MAKSISLWRIVQKLMLTAMPISMGRLINILGTVFAMMMVAHTGKDPMAASLLAMSATLAVLTLGSSIFYAIGIRIRFLKGKGQLSDVGVLIKNGFWLAILLGIPAALGTAYMDKILLAIGEDPHLVLLTEDYFYYAGLRMFPQLLMMVIGQYYSGIGKTSFVLIIELLSLPLTLIVSYGLILGHFGLPEYGLSGVSMANLYVQSCMLSGILPFVFFGKKRLKKPYLPSWQICRSILIIGLPIGVQFGGELAAIAAAACFMGYFGVDALAALQIVNQYSILVIMCSFGLAQALSLMISEAYGNNENDTDLIKKYVQASLWVMLFYLLPVTLLFCTLSTEFSEFYMGTSALSPELLHLVHIFFVLGGVFLLLDGMRNIFSAALRGLQESKTGSRINLLSMWLISLPVSYLAAFSFEGGPVFLRAGFLSGFLVAVLLLFTSLYGKLANGKVASRESIRI